MRLITIVAYLVATWIGTNAARIEHSAGCLYRKQTLIRCYDTVGVAIIGGSQTDAAFRPRAGDVFTLVSPSGKTERSPLRGIVRLPVLRR